MSNDGRYIALMRRSATNAYQIYVYNRTSNVYALRGSSSTVLEHPSVSNNAEKLAWYQQATATSNRLYVRDLLAGVSTLVVNTSSVLAHPHLSADGNYLTYAQQVSGRFVVYNRNLITNQQVQPVSTTASLTAPYWQVSLPNALTLGSSGGEILVSSGARATFEAGFLSTSAQIVLDFNANTPVDYPQGMQKLNEFVDPIASHTILTMPVSSINITATSRVDGKSLKIRVPSTITVQESAVAEIRLNFSDGTKHFALQQYRTNSVGINAIATDTITINSFDIKEAIQGHSGQTMTISVQPARFAPVSNGTLTTQDVFPQNKIIALAPETTEVGLYKITDTFDFQAFENNPPVTFDPFIGRIEDLPNGIVPATAGDLTSGKRPLIFIHGYEGALDAAKKIGTGFNYSIPAVYGTGTKEWIKNFYNDPAVRAKYDLYLFGYDSRDRIPIAGNILGSNIESVFGTQAVNIVSYSMGGNVTHDYLKRSVQTNVEKWVTVGTPFGGANGFYCKESTGSGCKSKDLNLATLKFVLFGANPAPGFDSIIGAISLAIDSPSVLDVTLPSPSAPYVNNPYSVAVNANTDYPDYVAIGSDLIGGFGIGDDILNAAFPSSDFLATTASACLATLNDCSDSPFGRVVIKSGSNHVDIPKDTWNDISTELLRGDFTIILTDLYSIPGATRVVSNVTTNLDNDGDRVHTSTAPEQKYKLPSGGFVARVGVFNSTNDLIFGLRKTFSMVDLGQTSWSPTASVSLNLKTNYNGPTEDCPRLEGTFTVDINGLYDAGSPTIQIDSSNSAMLINNSTFNILELQKLSNDPLQVNVKTLRSCNLVEGLNQLGWLLNNNFTGILAPEGFYVELQGPITIQDNRWPTLVWNLTSADAPAGGNACTGVPLNITVAPQNYLGELTQVFNNRPANSQSNILTRSNFVGNFYRFSFIDTDPDLAFSGSFDAPGPGFIDSKFTYRGVQAWQHYVIYRDPTDPDCGTNLLTPAIRRTSDWGRWTQFNSPKEIFTSPVMRVNF
jgi:hypothetical protein